MIKNYDQKALGLGERVLKEYARRESIARCLKTEQGRRRGELHIPEYSSMVAAYTGMSDGELARAIAYMEFEKLLCDHAIAVLPHELRGPASDVYTHGVAWNRAMEKWCLSSSGLFRRLKRAAEKIGKVLLPQLCDLKGLIDELYGGVI